jgi:NTP pyrophosphatase (non-canonical NTP hydrolase)
VREDADAGAACLVLRLMLGEEAGEIFKAVGKAVNMRGDQGSRVGAVGDEFAEAFIVRCAVANRLGVDMDQAFRREAANDRRSWQRTRADG